MLEQVEEPKGGCHPVESPCWSRLLVGPEAHGERSPCWRRFVGRTCDPVGDPRWSSLSLKDCTPWKGPTLEQFMDNCLLWEGPHAGAGAECEEEGAAETACNELTAAPIPRPPVLLRERK